MSIRQFAKERAHTIVGKLTRRADLEDSTSVKIYVDEAGNEYYINRHGVCIVAADGGVI